MIFLACFGDVDGNSNQLRQETAFESALVMAFEKALECGQNQHKRIVKSG